MPPELVLFEGDWPQYQRHLSQIFDSEIRGKLQFRQQKVSCRKHPVERGEWASFWHLVSEGKVEEDRTPDIRRCERLKWVSWIITNADSHENIDVWENQRKREKNFLLWFNEEYLVILSIRDGYLLLKTAYCTHRSGRVRQLRKERERAKKD